MQGRKSIAEKRLLALGKIQKKYACKCSPAKCFICLVHQAVGIPSRFAHELEMFWQGTAKYERLYNVK